MTYTHVRDLLGLFRNGYDSLEISYIAGLPEPTVYNQLNEQREAERLKTYYRENIRRELREDLNIHYRTLIPYAGKEK